MNRLKLFPRLVMFTGILFAIAGLNHHWYGYLCQVIHR